ncbi:MAG TPA: hypothetical protein VGS58_02145, partial [Candidatus Sulfopaludibacter sp.]|nr:hypothetical protein [Candidatus Sulfopaludibacter sp.]
QPAGALESCRKALAIRQALAARDPANPVQQRRLAMDYLRMSAIRQALSDSAGAQEGFRAASAILDQLNLQAPHDAGVSLDLALLCQNAANREFEAGDSAASRALDEKARALSRQVLQSHPEDPLAQYRLADSDSSLLHDFGGIRYAIAPADRGAALEAFREAAEIYASLAAASPSDSHPLGAMMSLSIRVCATTNLLDPAAQIDQCRKAALLANQSAANDPANVGARMAAITARHNLSGRMEEAHQEGAGAEQRRATELADRLFEERPDVSPVRFIAAIEHQSLAEFLLAHGDPAAALLQVRTAIRIREPLLLDPADIRPRMVQAESYSLLGDIEMRQSGCRAAVEAYRPAVALNTQLQDQHKLDPKGERLLADVRRKIANCAR